MKNFIYNIATDILFRLWVQSGGLQAKPPILLATTIGKIDGFMWEECGAPRTNQYRLRLPDWWLKIMG